PDEQDVALRRRGGVAHRVCYLPVVRVDGDGDRALGGLLADHVLVEALHDAAGGEALVEHEDAPGTEGVGMGDASTTTRRECLTQRGLRRGPPVARLRAGRRRGCAAACGALAALLAMPPARALDEVPFITTPDNVTLEMLRLAD